MHREVTAELGVQPCRATQSELFHHLGPQRGGYPRRSPTDPSWEVLSTTSPSPPWCLGETETLRVLKEPPKSLQSRKGASWCEHSWEQWALLPVTDAKSWEFCLAATYGTKILLFFLLMNLLLLVVLFVIINFSIFSNFCLLFLIVIP